MEDLGSNTGFYDFGPNPFHSLVSEHGRGAISGRRSVRPWGCLDIRQVLWLFLQVPRPTTVLFLRTLWSLLDGIWGILKGSCGVLVTRMVGSFMCLSLHKEPYHYYLGSFLESLIFGTSKQLPSKQSGSGAQATYALLLSWTILASTLGEVT